MLVVLRTVRISDSSGILESESFVDGLRSSLRDNIQSDRHEDRLFVGQYLVGFTRLNSMLTEIHVRSLCTVCGRRETFCSWAFILVPPRLHLIVDGYSQAPLRHGTSCGPRDERSCAMERSAEVTLGSVRLPECIRLRRSR